MNNKAYFEDEETMCNFMDDISTEGWTVIKQDHQSFEIGNLYVVTYTKF